MYAELRRELIAVKFCKPLVANPDYDGVELENEIHALTEALPAKHPRVIEAFDTYDDGHIQWLTTRYMTGGDLQCFVNKFPWAVSESLIWHIGYQIAEGLAHLFFGANAANNMSPAAGWPCIFHGDIHLGNLFLGPAVSGKSLGNFPDLVLADFGESDHYPASEQVPVTGFVTYLSHHVRDLYNAGKALEELLDVLVVDGRTLARDSVLLDGIDRFGAIRVEGPKKVSKEGILKLLSGFMIVADEQRRKYYQPMPADAAASLVAEKVSDGDLEMIFCRSGSHSKPKKGKR
ncbi:hypothetical protein LTR36_005140 [Oleoguttula mirabilis]|uniref:non-specific serine/threonine protein kinase n=1 Tax=Oleoguttula mirabilis TaxID=1507867 RepID=A0AAV9JVT0_9PEZI|nr:hypothetical protein LTR36_005140 [Oleoguttula mirabilis]